MACYKTEEYMDKELYEQCVEEIKKIENPEIKTTLLMLCKKSLKKKVVKRRDSQYGYSYICCPECDLEVCIGSEFCDHCGQAIY